MELFGYQLQTIYLFGLIFGGVFTFLYILFGDLLEGIFEALSEGPINLTLVLAFITFTSASGYILEKATSIHSIVVFIISIVLAFILVTLLNLFILIPLSQAESTLAYSEQDLKGRVGKVIVSIPSDGFGEVMIEGNGGNIAKSAVSFEAVDIEYGSTVLVIDVIKGVLHVIPHEKI